MSQDATGGNNVTLGFACLFRWKQLPAQTAIMISEVMKFICSDSCKIGITREKNLRKVQANYFFESI